MKSKYCAIVASYDEYGYSSTLANILYNATGYYEGTECNYYEFIDENDIEDVVDYIIGNMTDGGYIYAYTGIYFERFMAELYNRNDTKYKVVVLDRYEKLYQVTEHKEYYEGHYVLSSYLNDQDNDDNKVLKEFVDHQYADPKFGMDELSTKIQAISFMYDEAYAKAESSDVYALRKQLYKIKMNTAQGETSISHSNMMSLFISIGCITNNGDVKVVSRSPNPIVTNQFSPYLTNFQEYKTCNFEEEHENDEDYIVEDDVFKIGIIINKGTVDLSLHLILYSLLMKQNNNGGYLDRTIVSEKLYCPEDEDEIELLEEEIKNRDINYYFSNCQFKMVSKIFSDLKDDNYLFIDITKNDGSNCYNNVYNFILFRISFGSTPSERVLPVFFYFRKALSSYSFLILMTEVDEDNNERHLITSTIETLKGEYQLYIINETDPDSKNELRSIIEHTRINFPNGMTILNNLNKLFFKVFDNMIEVYSDFNDDNFDQNYFVITYDADKFKQLDIIHRVNNFLVTSFYVDHVENNEIQLFLQSLFGKDYLISEADVKIYISTDYLLNSLLSVLDDDVILIRDFMMESKYESPIGVINVRSTLYTDLPIILITCDKDDNYILRSVLSEEWYSEIFRNRDFNPSDYSVCFYNQSDILVIPSIRIIIAITLSGEYKEVGSEVFFGFFAGVDMVNYDNGVFDYKLLPYLIDVGSDPNDLKKYFSNTMEEYGTNIVFGLYGEEFRTEMKKLMHDENNEMFLFYPFDNDGDECDENILYMGPPLYSYVYYYIIRE